MAKELTIDDVLRRIEEIQRKLAKLHADLKKK